MFPIVYHNLALLCTLNFIMGRLSELCWHNLRTIDCELTLENNTRIIGNIF